VGRSGALLATGIVLASGTSCTRESPAPAESRLVVYGRRGVLRLNGRIPSGFPVSLLQGARPTTVIEPREEGSRERLVVLEADVDVLEAIRFYRADLLARGWVVERMDELEDEISTTILRSAGGRESVQVAVKRRIDGSRGSTIRVTWTEAEP